MVCYASLKECTTLRRRKRSSCLHLDTGDWKEVESPLGFLSNTKSHQNHYFASSGYMQLSDWWSSSETRWQIVESGGSQTFDLLLTRLSTTGLQDKIKLSFIGYDVIWNHMTSLNLPSLSTILEFTKDLKIT